ncbi:MAG: extracellular solute-binding protein, partial [Bacillota bacterium]
WIFFKKRSFYPILGFVVSFLLIARGCECSTEQKTDTTDTESTAEQAATSATTETKEPAEELPPLPKEITMFNAVPLSATTPAWETPIGKKIEELTGVKLKVEYLVGTDSMTKANLMTASGTYPDIVAAGETAGVFIAANAFIPLDDLIEKYGENIKKIYRPNELELSRLQYGKIYIISTNRPAIDNLYPAAGFYMNYAVLKDAGFPVVKTLSQYGKLIKDYMAKNPKFGDADNIGFTIPTEGYRVTALQYGAARFLGGYPNDGVTSVDQDTLEAKVVVKTQAAKEFARFLNDMWNSGCLDKETFMQKDDQYLAKVASGRLLGIYDQRWAVVNGLAALERNGHYDRTLVAFPVVIDGVEKEYYRGPYSFAVQGVSITTSCKDPEGVFRFLDRICAEDIQKLNYWGIEGVDYTIKDGKFTRTPEQWNNSFDTDYQMSTGLMQFLFLPRYEQTDDEVYGKFSDGNWVNPALNQEYNDMRYKDYEKEILKNYNVKTFCDFFAPAYPARYQPGWAARQQLPQDSEEFIASEKALQLATEYMTKIATAKPTDVDALWDEYQKKLDAIPGLEAYEKKITEIIRESSKYYK